MEKETTAAIRKPFGRGPRASAIRTVSAAVVIAGFVGGAIVTDGTNIAVSDNTAFARGGNGGGKGGGGRGGRGGGRGGENAGSHGDVGSFGQGRGHAKGHGHGHANGHDHVDGQDHGQGHGLGHAKGVGKGHGHSDPPGAPPLGNGASEYGISASALGSFNAAHASPTARQNASPNSMVGHIAAFVDAVESENIDAAAEALAAKANKEITEPVVSEVARLADVEVSEDTASAIAERAADIQAEESEEPIGQSMPSGS